ncbi:MAG: hypothetical protein ABR968_13250 [Bacteroidales bacterium]|jgi:hypothetical protein
MFQKALKYFFLLFIATVFLATSSGFVLYTSQCHCKEKQENTVTKEKSCCQANKQLAESKSCCQPTTSCAKHEKNSNCNRCNGEKIFVKLPVAGSVLLQGLLKNHVAPYYFNIAQRVAYTKTSLQIYLPETIKPPGNYSKRLYSLNSSFLI